MEKTPIRWQRLAALSRQIVASTLNGRTGARLLCALALVTGLALPVAHAQSGTGSISALVVHRLPQKSAPVQIFTRSLCR